MLDKISVFDKNVVTRFDKKIATCGKRAWIRHSHKKWHSLEIRAVKLRFILIYENMMKSIATTRSGCTAKHKNKASYNTDYIVPDLIEFFGNEHRLKKEIFMIVKSIVLIKIGLLSVTSDNFLSTIRKYNALAICISC